MNIWAYVLRRLLYAIPIILGVTLIIFILFNVFAGDPTLLLLGKHGSAQQAAELRRELGLDKPMYLQYFDVVKSVFTFDFGRSWSTRQQISSMILDGIGPTLSLSVPAFFFSTLIAIAISLVAAWYRGKWIDRTIVFGCIFMMSISVLSYILFGQYILAYKWGLFEISGYEFGFPYFIPYILLPMIIWIVLSMGHDVRFYRTVMLDEVYQDYVRTARAKGLSEKKILFKHVLKNAMIPIITYVMNSIPFLILGAVLFENFFGIPGLGGMVLNAINSNDFPVLKAMAVITSISYILFNTLTDVLYTLVDPRVRLK